ncbi:ABC transporter permease [Scrofimicrobium sp. R131]|uniref:ABC transporter permease n=1 Tax=Scrofimicrobium appendicitidis TaxID=3079930 RepID=A0AAU7V996_9ACTO
MNQQQVTLPIQWRDPVVSAIMTVLTLILTLFSKGYSNISFNKATTWFEGGVWTIPAATTGWLMVAIAAVVTVLIWVRAIGRKKVSAWLLGLVGVAFVITFLVWMVADRPTANLPLVSLLSGGLMFATPLVFGALAGVVNERSGVINIAIEGQLLLGAFAGVLVGSMFGTSWVGLIGAPLAGMGLAVLLAWFTITFRTENIVVGVVLNMLALGLTSFLFSTLLKNSPHLNQPMRLPIIRIPVLADIPVIGPVLFNQTILVYLMYAAVIIMQFMLFNSRWGLRVRASGEKPKAADTVGIKVNSIRWHSVLLGGALAGLGGAVFTIGQDLAFSKDMAAGNGFIALAAMILGRWNPTGALAASLLFGFATSLGIVMQSVGAPIPAEYVLMTPYIVTILAVAGFVGAVRPPAEEGKPYP